MVHDGRVDVDRVIAIVLAGGSGSRFGAAVPKVLVDLAGRPVLAHSLEVLDRHPSVDDVVIVVREADQAAVNALDLPRRKLRALVAGGATRQGSELAGIRAAQVVVGGLDPRRVVALLHDAARPLVSPAVVTRVLQAVRDGAGGAIPGLAVPDSLVDADGRGVAADDLVAVQTPQAFPLGVLLAAYPAAAAGGVDGVDTAETVQAVSDVAVRWVPGDAENLKITHPADLARAEALLSRRRVD
jgi:2-C-methyl-D-erythritol 4-phosphate cytidylyltransferase